MIEQRVPIGTILKIKDTQMMVVGYEIVKGNEKAKIVYKVVPHPLGYRQYKDIHHVECLTREIIKLGYVTEESEFLERCLINIEKGLGNAPKDAIAEFYELLNKGDETNEE